MILFKKYISLVLLFLVALANFDFVLGQEFPPLQKFSSADYEAGDQNWSITQDDDQAIFIANNKGLLEYNGAQWDLHTVGNQAIMRSVAYIDQKIFTGSYMDFGFWESDNSGGLNYTSLASLVGEPFIEDEEFWNIIGFKKWILFQSLDRIYIYDKENKGIEIITTNGRISQIFNVDNSIFFQSIGEGLYKIESGTNILVSADDIVKRHEIVDMYNINNELTILTKTKGFFSFKDDVFTTKFSSLETVLEDKTVYSSLKLQSGNIVLGTISDGIIEIDRQGNIILQMNQKNGLSNNTVLSLFEDSYNNLWLGLDNGVDILNLKSPYRVYNDRNGSLGTVYTSALYNGVLYLGTNQGLFCRSLESNEDFTLIESTEGQVWKLQVIDNTLLCGHDTGAFQIFDKRAERIIADNGVWEFKKTGKNSPYVIQGTYEGLSLLKNVNGQWVFSNNIEGFDISSRYLEFVNPSELLVSHEYKGVFKLNLSPDYKTVNSFSALDVEKSIGSALFKYRGDVMYANNSAVFKYENNDFKKTEFLKPFYTSENYVSGKMIEENNEKRLWAFFKNQIVYVDPGNLSNKPLVNSINLPAHLRKSKDGFENILKLKDQTYLLGTTKGYVVMDLLKSSNINYKVSIDKVSFSVLNEDKEYLNLNEDIELPNDHNNLHFQYSIPGYRKLETSMYQFRLKGAYDDWSNWTDNTNQFFENLPFGDYIFEVRAKVGGQISENTASYQFSVLKPWYLKPLAIIIYVLLFVVFLAIVQLLNTRYYRKKQKAIVVENERELEIREIESQRKMVELKNENLRQDIENKNRELGTSTMNLIKKNEILNTIKEELLKANSPKDYNAVIKTIDKNLNATDDWKRFEEAFNNADKDFVKKMKKKHSSLTSNDLRLCAYLRLNLSSKEIAPLLNISPKSVEVKRYRLRKKMDLRPEQSLTDYILKV